MNQKKIFLVFMITIVIVSFIILIRLLVKYRERNLKLETRTAGMTVTMLGGSNMKENGNIIIENIYYSFNSLEWYRQYMINMDLKLKKK